MSIIKQIFELSELLQALTYQEFENLTLDLVYNSKKFKNPIKSRAGKDSGYDIYADEEVSPSRLIKAVFQIKKLDLLTIDYINQIGFFWQSKNWFKNSKLYIVTSGTLTNESSDKAKELGIEIWDVYKIYKLITPEIENKYYAISSKSESETESETREEKLSIALNTLAKGKSEWVTFQKLSGDIITHLFSPPLSSPRFEHPDSDRKNRRDMIFENSSEHPFWKSIREIYKGYYIVVDAKNYANSIEKRSVIEIAHYLKPYGCGMFGIILTRIGIGKSAEHAIKEQWIGNDKLIIVLSDNDLLEMLKIKQANGKPEEIIKMKIADFRMSL